jgi:excisionase family DNA binding protein
MATVNASPNQAKPQVRRLLLRGTEVAEALGISKALAYRWMNDGTLPTIRKGRLVRVPAGALEDFIAQRMRGE